ncbi:hypothetical protein Anapl_13426 [Anas platyrhynchos]|uniref:Uncharacterized protein n=1 Tax=Anas platyrhynchos TaxID=8839 RepID=R0LJ29_ANAPL|nr:hypothetical protein Anapl_13426 [Anas platyrhynchos]
MVLLNTSGLEAVGPFLSSPCRLPGLQLETSAARQEPAVMTEEPETLKLDSLSTSLTCYSCSLELLKASGDAGKRQGYCHGWISTPRYQHQIFNGRASNCDTSPCPLCHESQLQLQAWAAPGTLPHSLCWAPIAATTTTQNLGTPGELLPSTVHQKRSFLFLATSRHGALPKPREHQPSWQKGTRV